MLQQDLAVAGVTDQGERTDFLSTLFADSLTNRGGTNHPLCHRNLLIYPCSRCLQLSQNPPEGGTEVSVHWASSFGQYPLSRRSVNRLGNRKRKSLPRFFLFGHYPFSIGTKCDIRRRL